LGLILGFSSALNAEEEQSPSIPVGSLSAFPTIVQTGTKPQLTWDITLPETVPVVIDPPGTVTPTRDLYMDVRILGAGVTSYNSHNGILTFVPTECQINYNGQGYDRIFYGNNNSVNPNKIVHTQFVEEGSTINLGGRYYWNKSWGTWFSSTMSSYSYNVVALQNGDIPPTTTPMHQAPTIETFLRPYLAEDGRIEIGPRDIIYLLELTHTDQSHGGWDLQDLAVLLTFYDEVSTENNNGHGNNVDGVDSSNPRDSMTGEDSDPNVDDEKSKKRGRRKK
ncbi:MAG: hypothetical protein P1U87_16695, partial [Verrucomicrobiales bacterium]|nr:hypothetical protein [Verrucomicrobiales bacterium]